MAVSQDINPTYRGNVKRVCQLYTQKSELQFKYGSFVVFFTQPSPGFFLLLALAVLSKSHTQVQYSSSEKEASPESVQQATPIPDDVQC